MELASNCMGTLEFIIWLVCTGIGASISTYITLTLAVETVLTKADRLDKLLKTLKNNKNTNTIN